MKKIIQEILRNPFGDAIISASVEGNTLLSKFIDSVSQYIDKNLGMSLHTYTQFTQNKVLYKWYAKVTGKDAKGGLFFNIVSVSSKDGGPKYPLFTLVSTSWPEFPTFFIDFDGILGQDVASVYDDDQTLVIALSNYLSSEKLQNYLKMILLAKERGDSFVVSGSTVS